MKKALSKSSAQKGESKARSFFPGKMEGNFFAKKSTIQTKLQVGQVNDPYEREADQVADHVVDKGETLQSKTDKITPFVRKGEVSPKQEEVLEMDEKPAQAKAQEGEPMLKVEPVQKQEEVQEMDEEPAQAKAQEGEPMLKEEPVQKQEEVQEMDEEPAQAKAQEGEPMLKEEPVQKQEEVQEMDEEPAQAKAQEGEPMLKEEPVQKQEEVQEMDEEPAQAKAQEGEPMLKEEPVQKQEEVQEMDEEPAQAKAQEGEPMLKEEPVQKQEEVQEMDEEPAQAKAQEGEPMLKEEKGSHNKDILPGVPLGVEKLLKTSKGKGGPLPEGVRNQMESSFGAEFSEVQIHTDGIASSMSKQLGALAFAHGKDIYFNTGKFDPNSKKGRQLLAHELTHTIQQGAVEIKSEEDQTVSEQHLDELAPAYTATTPTGTNQTIKQPSAANAEKASLENATELGQSPEIDISKGETPLESADTAVEEEEQSVPRSPEEDPNFQALQERADSTAQQQKKHTPSNTLSQNAGDAAPSPSNEPMSQAQAGQVNEMEEAEPQLFDAAGFKKVLLDKIIEILPKNEAEAGKFKKNNRMDEVKNEASNKVETEKTKAAGAIETATVTPPDENSVPKRTTVELKTPVPGAKPASLEAAQAMPPQRPNSEVVTPLQENAQEVDDEMAQNNADEQLAESEEPTFVSALDSKKTTQQDAKTSLITYVKKKLVF